MAVTTVETIIGTLAALTAWVSNGPRDATLDINAACGTGSTSSAIVLDSTASTTANAYIGNTLTIAGETRLITAYNTTTKTATVGSLNGGAATFSAAPAQGTAYNIGPVIWRGKQSKVKITAPGTLALLSGRTASATAYYEYTADTGASWQDDPAFLVKALRHDPSYATLESTGGGAAGFDLQVPYSRVSGVQFVNLTASASVVAPLSIIADHVTVSKCLIDSTANNSAARGALKFISPSGTLSDSVVVQRSADAAAIIANLGSGVSSENVTFANTSGTKQTVGISLSYVGGSFLKCAVMGVLAATSSNLTPTVTSCATDGTQTGWATVPFSTANFVTPTDSGGLYDLRLASGSALIVAGSHDIGAWENPPVADTTAPTLTGPTATASGANSATGSVGTDEAGGTLYWIASSNATPLPATVKLGNSQAVTATGAQNVIFAALSPSTTYYPSFLQKDSAGNESTVVTGAAFTTPALDQQAPTWPNGASITPGTITTSSLSGSYPAASDNVGVHHYETSKDNGATWQNNGAGLTWQFSGLASGTNFPIAVSAVDAQGNRSALLTLSMSTSAAPNSASFKSGPLENNAGTLWATGTMIKWEWRQARIGNQGVIVYGSSQVASDGTITATGLPTGAGALLAEEPGASWATGSPCYQPGTAA
jgi:hypothetical protein